MLDLSHLPKPQNGYIDYFPGSAAAATSSWQTWNKPRGINFIKIICIGGGGGGRSGWCANSATRSGGGGGGSGSISHVTIPAIFFPDRLYVSAGNGGVGGAASFTNGSANAGSSGGDSIVAIAPSNAAIYCICIGQNGYSGTSGNSTISDGGSAGNAISLSSSHMAGQGNFTSLAGQPGTDGATGAGTSIVYPTTGLLLSGGASGGGGQSQDGGGVNAPASQTSIYSVIDSLLGGSGASTPAGTGSAGRGNLTLLAFSGGSGGASAASITATAGDPGGAGGNGAIGCGGGGGGAGPTTSGSGRGGDGGPGLVIISCW
jgi:hypothetical protein